MKRLKTILQSKYLFLIILLLSISYSLIRIKIGYQSKIKISNNLTGTVVNIQKKPNKYQITIKSKENVICYYQTDKVLNINLGDTLLLTGKYDKPSNNTIFNNFNYKEYLANNKIFYLFNIDKIKIIKRNNNLIYSAKNKINKRIDKYKYKEYLRAFIIGDKSNLEDYSKFQENGISHLFALSGMHVGIFALFLEKLLKKVRYKDLIIILFLIFYSFIVNFSLSFYRSIIMYILVKINHKFNLNIEVKNILFLTLSILIFYNPLVVKNISFLYSAVVTYGLIISSKYFKNNYFLNLLMISIFSFLFSLPITLYFNYKVNLLSIINNLVVVPLISLIIYPLCLITFLIKEIEPIFNFLLNIFIYINNFLNRYSLTLVIGKIKIIYLLLYYLLLIIFVYKENKKCLLLGISVFLLIKIYPYFDNNLVVYYLDVSQGDSILLKKRNKIYLIDTGGSKNGYISENIIKFINSLSFNKIETLILTHGDFDHMGDAVNLVSNIKTENIVFNCGEFNDLENELIKVLDKKKIRYYSCIKELNIDKDKLQFLNTKEYDNENDNSNVIYLNYEGYKFLFMGDAGIKKEKDILEKYNLKTIHFFKVGHHGSNTSSSKNFIAGIKPKYSLISVGKNNRYGHPKQEVLDTLKNSKIYRTDLDGSIEVKLNKNGYKIRTCPP